MIASKKKSRPGDVSNKRQSTTCNSNAIVVQRRRRRQYAVSSLLVVCIGCATSSTSLNNLNGNLWFTEAAFLPSGSRYARRRALGLNTNLYATVENETIALSPSGPATNSLSSFPQHNGNEIKNRYGLDVGATKEFPTRNQPEVQGVVHDNDWYPENNMNLHYGSLEDNLGKKDLASTSKDPFYAERTSSTIEGAHTNGFVVKPLDGAANGKKNGIKSPSALVELPKRGIFRESETLSGSDGSSEYDEVRAKVSRRLSSTTTEQSPSTTSRSSKIRKRGSKRRRVREAARRVWKFVSPVQIFRSTGEANEAKAEKQRTREAATFERKSRRKKKKLSNLLKSVSTRNTKNMAGITSRTLTGLITALAEEADGISVRMDAKEDTPIWRKQIDSVRIEFTRLGFKPLYMGGPDQLLASPEEDRLEISRPPVVKEKKKTKGSSSSGAAGKVDENDDDSCPVEYTLDNEGLAIGAISCADTAFQQIDVDNSGALDKDEIAEALVIAATSSSSQMQQAGGGFSKAASEVGDGSRKIIRQLAKQLVDLYDTNDDGVIDRNEYQSMVEDMAALRKVQKEKEQDKNGGGNPIGNLWSNLRGAGNATSGDDPSRLAPESMEPETTGKIVLENVKIDLRQVIFGAIPIVKHILPGGPLFLEPLKATVTASFTAEDIMKSTLLDAGLRQLVSFALRVRVRSLRDLADGAVFYGRKWLRDSAKAPRVECTELISVEIDDQDRAIITGRAKVRATPDAPTIVQSFKLRTKVATPRNGRAIKLSEAEIALIVECPKQLEENINKTFASMNMKPPPKPKPFSAYIPIHSPFKKNDDTGGYYMGEDNRLKSLSIKDKCLRFEMEATLRPGKFLGSHYLAFTVPQRALIITVDRVTEGMKAARRRKKKLKALEKAREAETNRKAHHAEDALELVGEAAAIIEETQSEELEGSGDPDAKEAPAKGFISRFVDGYVQAGESENSREKLAHAISDWFGRQGTSDSVPTSAEDLGIDLEDNGATNEVSRVVEEITLGVIRDDQDNSQGNLS